MTGDEHWAEADRILTQECCVYDCPRSGCCHEMWLTARAQAHAMLALAASISGMREHRFEAGEGERP